MRTSLRRSTQLLQTPGASRRALTTHPREAPAQPQTPKTRSISICQACHRPLLPTSRTQTHHQRRLQSSSTSASSEPPPNTKPETPLPSDPSLPTSHPKTHYDLFPLSFPRGPPPSGPFPISPRLLRREFLTLQQKSHPDLFPPHLRARAEATSSLINTAYKTLQSPLLRAQYLLSLRGIETEGDEGGRVEDMGLLGEVMEVRESVDECCDEGTLERLRGENEERIERVEGEVGGALEGGRWEEARGKCVELRYWYNVRESIEGWEKGRGGGNLGH